MAELRDEDLHPEVHPFMPQPGCNVCVCGSLRDDPWHLSRRADPVEWEAIHGWFNLTYANYLVLPRSVLQSMPPEWQSSFVALLKELEAAYGGLEWPDYSVNARRGGRFVKDPIPHYNRGRTRVEPCPPSWAAPADAEAALSGSSAPCGAS